MQRFVLQRRFQRVSALYPAYSTTSSSLASATSATSISSLHEQYRKDILNASLHHVHQHGWTEDAIAHGVVKNTTEKKYPPSFIGMMNDNHSKSSDLIHYFMKECNLKLKSHLKDYYQQQNVDVGTGTDNTGTDNVDTLSHADVLKYGIQYRLEMVIPFVKSNKWSQGMALGAKPYNAMSTASHLEEIVTILEHSLLHTSSTRTSTGASASASASASTHLSPIERTAIGAVYIATELHLLADTSPNYQDTWSFLNDRVNDLNTMATLQQQNPSSLPLPLPQLNQETMIAGVAVASSLGSAVLSLMTPVARGGVSAVAGTVVPQVMNFMSYAASSTTTASGGGGMNGTKQGFSTKSTAGTSAKDYDVSDLPPFDTIEDDQLDNRK